MSEYEITGVRQNNGDGRTHHIEAVKVGDSLFLVDQIITWVRDDAHRFWIWFQNRKTAIITLQHGSTRRYYLTVEGGGFPPVALLSLPRI
jgi:hypothetical protein